MSELRCRCGQVNLRFLQILAGPFCYRLNRLDSALSSVVNSPFCIAMVEWWFPLECDELATIQRILCFRPPSHRHDKKQSKHSRTQAFAGCNPLGTGILQPFQIFSSFSCLARSSGASTTMPSATSTCTSSASVSSCFLRYSVIVFDTIRYYSILFDSIVLPSRSLWRSLVADPSFLGSALYLSGSVLFAAMPYWSAASPATMTKMGQAQPGTVTALAAVAS